MKTRTLSKSPTGSMLFLFLICKMGMILPSKVRLAQRRHPKAARLFPSPEPCPLNGSHRQPLQAHGPSDVLLPSAHAHPPLENTSALPQRLCPTIMAPTTLCCNQMVLLAYSSHRSSLRILIIQHLTLLFSFGKWHSSWVSSQKKYVLIK